jgi:hypothetical protein
LSNSYQLQFDFAGCPFMTQNRTSAQRIPDPP